MAKMLIKSVKWTLLGGWLGATLEDNSASESWGNPISTQTNKFRKGEVG